MPTIARNVRLNVAGLSKPTAKHVSVTLYRSRSIAIARSILLRCRYRCGVSPNVARKVRVKWAGDISAIRANAGRSSGRPKSRSIASRARSSRRFWSSDGLIDTRYPQARRRPRDHDPIRRTPPARPGEAAEPRRRPGAASTGQWRPAIPWTRGRSGCGCPRQGSTTGSPPCRRSAAAAGRTSATDHDLPLENRVPSAVSWMRAVKTGLWRTLPLSLSS